MRYTAEHTAELLKNNDKTYKINKHSNVVFKPYSNIGSILSKAKMVGIPCNEFKGIVAIYKKSVVELHAEDEIQITSDKGSRLFSGLELDSIDFSNVDFQQLKNMDWMFRDSKIKHIDLSKADLSNVKSMSSAFYEFESDEVDLSNKDFTNLAYIDYAFEHAVINNIILDNCKFNKIYRITGMFCNTYSDKISMRNVELKYLHSIDKLCIRAKSKLFDFTGISADNLVSMESSFDSVTADEINIKFKNRTYVKYMSLDFKCIVQKLKIKNLGIKDEGSIDTAFSGCQTDELDLSDIIINRDVSGVRTLSNMKVRNIKLNKTFENLINIKELFEHTTTDRLGLDNLDFKSMILTGTFRNVRANKLDLRECTFKNAITMIEMFRDAQIEELRLDKANMESNCDMSWLFTNSRIQNIYIKSEALKTIENHKSALFNNEIMYKNIID